MSERADGKLKLIDRFAGIPVVSLIGLLRRRRKLPGRIERIGLFKEACIGDTILLAGILEDLRKRYPASKIVLFTGSTNYGVAKLLAGWDEVVKLPVTSPLKCVRIIRQHPVDVLIDFGQWPRINALYSWLWKSDFTIGFSTPGQYRHFAYDRSVQHMKDRHEVENYRALAVPLGVVSESMPRIVAPECSSAPAIEGRYVIFHPWPGGTLSHVREWAWDRWTELAKRLDGVGVKVVITGGPADRGRAVALADGMGLQSVHNRAGLDDLPAVACLLSKASAVVSVNTGVMHLAAALGAATIGLNGPTSELRWGPIGPKATSISVPPPFGGYLNLGFEYEGRPLDCMERICRGCLGTAATGAVRVTSIVLLDRDGVLNVDLADSVRSLDQARMIPGAAKAVSLLNRKGYKVAVVTNQACVGRGWLNRSELDAIHEWMSGEISAAGGCIDAWFICTHVDAEDCDCRKPRPGLLLQAQARYGFDPTRTWFVGDAGRDIEAAAAAGCRPALVLTGKGKKTALSYPNIPCYSDLLEFARSLPSVEAALAPRSERMP